MRPETEANTDAELERALLAALLTDNRAFDRLGPLEPEDLADPMHAAALTAMLDLRAEGRAVNITLRSRFTGVPIGEGSVRTSLASGRPKLRAGIRSPMRLPSINA
jgi:hypothetical protein